MGIKYMPEYISLYIHAFIYTFVFPYSCILLILYNHDFYYCMTEEAIRRSEALEQDDIGALRFVFGHLDIIYSTVFHPSLFFCILLFDGVVWCFLFLFFCGY